MLVHTEVDDDEEEGEKDDVEGEESRIARFFMGMVFDTGFMAFFKIDCIGLC